MRTLGESAGSALWLNNNDVTVEARLPHSPSLAAPFFLPLENARGAPRGHDMNKVNQW